MTGEVVYRVDGSLFDRRFALSRHRHLTLPTHLLHLWVGVVCAESLPTHHHHDWYYLTSTRQSGWVCCLRDWSVSDCLFTFLVQSHHSGGRTGRTSQVNYHTVPLTTPDVERRWHHTSTAVIWVFLRRTFTLRGYRRGNACLCSRYVSWDMNSTVRSSFRTQRVRRPAVLLLNLKCVWWVHFCV